MPARFRLRSAASALFSLSCACAAAQGTAGLASLADLSLEQLTSIEVTSVSKRVQRLADVAASVYVIQQDDIRRSGATSIPEALRLAPNLQVARADTNQWAITARGFNSTLTNKMLVLIDGRTVYSPLFSGVFWEAQDVLLEDVERIEVLSGPGGTLYGSNAVNGVINIITRGAADTQGTLAAATLGRDARILAARHGATTDGGTAWRVWGKRSLRDNSENAAGGRIRDASHRSQAGFRGDRVEGGSQLTLQGDAYEGHIDQSPTARRISGVNLLARYSRDFAGGARGQLQAYFDRTGRDQPGSVDDTLDTVDVEYQHLSQPLPNHQLLWGGGWRRQQDSLVNLNPASLAFIPADRTLSLWNLFAQDEFALGDSLKATLGLKLEHNDYTGSEYLPNARLAWQLGANHLLWGAVSRTVRAPSRIDRDVVTPALSLGGANFRSEVARVYELGLRGQPDTRLSYSFTLFQHDFERLRSVDASPAGVSFNNNLEGRIRGLESWGRWRVSDDWRVNASYVHQDYAFSALPGTAPVGGASQLGNDPRYRVMLGTAFDVTPNLEFDVQVRRTGALPSPAVPAYTAIDARLGWRVHPGLELSVTARNLSDPRHPEWGSPAVRPEFDRGLFFKAVWKL